MDTKTILSVDAFMGWCLIAMTVNGIIFGVYIFLLLIIGHIIALIPDNYLRSILSKITAFIAGLLYCLMMIPLGGVSSAAFFTDIPPLTVSIMIVLIGIVSGVWCGMRLYYGLLVTIESVQLRQQEIQNREKVQ